VELATVRLLLTLKYSTRVFLFKKQSNALAFYGRMLMGDCKTKQLYNIWHISAEIGKGKGKEGCGWMVVRNFLLQVANILLIYSTAKTSMNFLLKPVQRLLETLEIGGFTFLVGVTPTRETGVNLARCFKKIKL